MKPRRSAQVWADQASGYSSACLDLTVAGRKLGSRLTSMKKRIEVCDVTAQKSGFNACVLEIDLMFPPSYV